ncbi:MAG: sterol carrier family protein [Actinomycetaceae bacterium]|nr:sterol carrier family protein [Actinomycetaceae bacterium]
MRRRISTEDGLSALEKWMEDPHDCDRAELKVAVRWALEELAERCPGRAVEVRVPPFGATQVFGGVTHRRGTPPAVIEMDVNTWLGLVSGQLAWDEAVDQGTILASGNRADLRDYLPFNLSCLQ